MAVATVSNLMSSEVITSNPKETLSKVIGKMSTHSLHEIPVVDENNELLGYFDFDVLYKKRHIPMYTKIENLMVAPPKVGENDVIFEAAKIMLETGFRAIPVVDKMQCLKGMISRTDLIKAIPKFKEIKNKKAEEIMTSEPKVLQLNDKVEKAMSLMIELGELAAPVSDKNGKIAGCILIEDISKNLWYNEEGQDVGDLVGENSKRQIEVGAFVSPVAVVKKEDSMKSLSEEMAKINPYLCIVSDGFQKPIGVITQYDILKELVEYTIEKGVYVDITGLDVNDPLIYSGMTSKIERFIEKTGRYRWITPFSLNLHIETYEKGGRKKWSMRARFRTDKGLIYVKSIGWDILRCVDEIVDELNTKVLSLKRRTDGSK